MKFLLRIVDLLLYTSLFTACCATGLCMATERFINGATPLLASHLHLLLFGGTLIVYNAPRLIHRQGYKRQHFGTWYFLFFLIGTGMVIPCIFWLPWHILALCLALAAPTFAYSLPLLPFKNKKRLREFGWLKILVLAGVWTTATSVLPVLYWQKNPAAYPFEILLRFVFIFAICVVFDIRDMRTDLRNNIDTLPHKVGIKNSYRMISTSLLLFAILSVIQYLRHPAIERLAAAWATAIITWLVVTYLRKKPSDRGYMGLADGVMLVYSLFILWH